MSVEAGIACEVCFACLGCTDVLDSIDLTGGRISKPPPLSQQPGGSPGPGHGGQQHGGQQHGGQQHGGQQHQPQQEGDLLWKIFRKLEKACCVVM